MGSPYELLKNLTTPSKVGQGLSPKAAPKLTLAGGAGYESQAAAYSPNTGMGYQDYVESAQSTTLNAKRKTDGLCESKEEAGSNSCETITAYLDAFDLEFASAKAASREYDGTPDYQAVNSSTEIVAEAAELMRADVAAGRVTKAQAQHLVERLTLALATISNADAGAKINHSAKWRTHCREWSTELMRARRTIRQAL